MRIAMQRASTCDALSYLATRSSTLNEPEILSKQPEPLLTGRFLLRDFGNRCAASITALASRKSISQPE
jgi:hypothetical protein